MGIWRTLLDRLVVVFCKQTRETTPVPLLERLESRVLLSADPVGLVTHDIKENSGLGEHAIVMDGEFVTPSGSTIFFDPISDPLPPEEARAAAEADPRMGPMALPLENTFQLHSHLGATKTIYLDFDGHTTADTYWNSDFTGGAPIVTPAYSTEGDSSFSDAELEMIQRIWARVAEDYIPFDVDVTTEDPGLEALRNTGGDDAEWGARIVIGPNTWFQPAGGVAYVGSFTWGSDTPAFVFNVSEFGVSEAASHEAGHTLGLFHDGTSSLPYYEGHGTGATGWAPIMGLGYYQPLVQWSRGEYPDANNSEDDLAIITALNGFGYRTDDHGDTPAGASPVEAAGTSFSEDGVIEQTADVDYFTFNSGSGDISLNIEPASPDPNLDILATLYDAGGGVIATSNPIDKLNASFDLSLAAGQYYLGIEGVGAGNLATGYSDYGSLGYYSIVGNAPSPPPPMAQLADPREGQSIGSSDLNARQYLDVTFSNPGDIGLDDASITDAAPEFTIAGAVGDVAFDGAAIRVSDTTFRYRFSGAFEAGAVEIAFQPGSFANILGSTNEGGLAHFSVTSAPFSASADVIISTDNKYELYVNGVLLGTGSDWRQSGTFNSALQPGTNVIAVKGVDVGGFAALLADITISESSEVGRIGTNDRWKVSTQVVAGWASVEFDDSGWANATEYGAYGVSPWGKGIVGMPNDTPGQWIWSSNALWDNTVYLRYSLTLQPAQPSDLFGSSFQVSPSSLVAGGHVNLTYTVSNDESGAAGGFDVAAYLSKDGVIEPSDRLLGNDRVEAVPGSGATTVEWQGVPLPAQGDPFWRGDGTYSLGVLIDPSNEVAENDEGNNANRGTGLDLGSVQIANTSDTAAPKIVGVSPSPDTRDVALDSSLVIVFDEAIEKGSGTVEIRRTSGDTILESIDVAGTRVTVTDDQVTITPLNDFSPQTDYYIRVTGGAFTDLSDNPFAGISDSSTWSFTTAAAAPATADIILSSDNSFQLFLNGTLLGTGDNWRQSGSFATPLSTGTNVIAVKGVDAGGFAALLAEITITDSSGSRRVGSSSQWKVSTGEETGWAGLGFDDSSWANASEYGAYGASPWGKNVLGMPNDTPGQWIWSANSLWDNSVYLRHTFNVNAIPEYDHFATSRDMAPSPIAVTEVVPTVFVIKQDSEVMDGFDVPARPATYFSQSPFLEAAKGTTVSLNSVPQADLDLKGWNYEGLETLGVDGYEFNVQEVQLLLETTTDAEHTLRMETSPQLQASILRLHEWGRLRIEILFSSSRP